MQRFVAGSAQGETGDATNACIAAPVALHAVYVVVALGWWSSVWGIVTMALAVRIRRFWTGFPMRGLRRVPPRAHF